MTEGEKRRRQRRRNYIKEFIKEHEEQIVNNGAESNGLKPSKLTKNDMKTILKTFRNDFEARVKDFLTESESSKRSYYDLNQRETKKWLKKTLGGSAYTSSEERDFRNLRQVLMGTGQWKALVNILNNKHKMNYLDMASVSVPVDEPGIRKQWEYTIGPKSKIVIKLHYEADGSSWFEMYRADDKNNVKMRLAQNEAGKYVGIRQ